MPSYRTPGVYVEERPRGTEPIEGVGTSTAGFLGVTERGPVEPTLVRSFAEFERMYGGYTLYRPNAPLDGTYLAYAVEGFFANGGVEAYVGRVVPEGMETAELSLRAVGTGPADATPTVDVSALDFGTVVAGTAVQRVATLTNPTASAGGRPIPFADITCAVEGSLTASPDVFTISDDRGGASTFSPGETLKVTVEVSGPHDERRAESTLRISLGGSRFVDVELTADLPEDGNPSHTLGTERLVVDLQTVEFGAERAEELAITNLTGTAVPVEDVTVELGQGDESPFAVGFDTGLGASGTADETRNATVRFTPPAGANPAVEDVLRVRHAGSSGSPVVQFEVALRATVGSDFTVDPKTLTLDAGDTETVTITSANAGEGDEVPTGGVELTLAGPDADAFSQDRVMATLGADESVEVDVGLAATDELPRQAALHVTRVLVTGDEQRRLSPVAVDLVGNPVADAAESAVVSAVGPGQWGEQVAMFLTEGTHSTDETPRFTITLRYWAARQAYQLAVDGDADPDRDGVPAPDVEEVYENLTADPASGDHYATVLNRDSTLVEVRAGSALEPARWPGPVWLSGAFDPAADEVAVSDYVGTAAGERPTGLRAFEAVDEIAVVCIPDERNDIPGNEHPLTGLTGAVVEHCTASKDRFAVLQSPQSADLSEEPPVSSRYAAFYYPWLEVVNPETNAFVRVPPGGHICGIYARSDSERGVHKAPANEPVRNVAALTEQVTRAEQASLNPRGINCLRQFPGRGIRVWGARTTASDPTWRYVNVQRLFAFLEESIDEGTQWVVFEPNTERLWARVRQSVRNFLTTVWRRGALTGTTPEEAFFVRCDRTTMSQADIDAGRLVIEVGVAPTKPAEYVLFRVSQVTADADGD